MKASRKTLIRISGLTWFLVGLFLMGLGLNFLVGAITALNDGVEKAYPVVQFLSLFLGGEEITALLLIASACFVGFLKGSFVLRKAVARGVAHIRSLPEPCSIHRIYPKRYYLLLGSMVLLGVLAKWLPLDIRGCIDVAIGVALLHGSLLFFRASFSSPKVASANA